MSQYIEKSIIVAEIEKRREKNARNKLNLAWLEKQNTSVEINPTEFDTRLQNLIGRFKDLPKDDIVGSLSFWLNVVHNDGTYKDEKPNDTFCKKNCKGYQETGKCFSDGDCEAKIKAEKKLTCSEKKLEEIETTESEIKGKERTTWKPSDKQIIALRWVLNNIPYNTNKEEISGLLEQIQNI